jgi:hypothetical protein
MARNLNSDAFDVIPFEVDPPARRLDRLAETFCSLSVGSQGRLEETWGGVVRERLQGCVRFIV